jgi:hypothetical protein
MIITKNDKNSLERFKKDIPKGALTVMLSAVHP